MRLQPLACGRSVSPTQPQHARRLFVTKLPTDISVSTLVEHFEQNGNVRRGKLLSADDDGGRAVVTHVHSRDARAAIETDSHRICLCNAVVMMARHR